MARLIQQRNESLSRSDTATFRQLVFRHAIDISVVGSTIIVD
jgi:hypothetical protein